jgi:very-short-patch-repair endonuclease/DNA-directed RNA polymerase subunit RPC12/RpoP
MVLEVIIFSKHIKVKSIEKSEQICRLKKFQTLLVNKIYPIKQRDQIVYICHHCKKKKTEKFNSNSKFFEEEILCRECGFTITKIAKYGSANASSRIKQGIQKKYGVDNPSQIVGVKEKKKQTMLTRYGIETNFNNPKYKKIKLKNSYLKFKTFDKVVPLFNLQEYLDKKEKYQKFDWRCITCNTVFQFYYANGTLPRCPICFPKQNGSSLVEKQVVDFVKQLSISSIEENTKKIIPPYELDIYLPKHKLAIEFDGIYWHSELNGGNKTGHLQKTNLCEQHGIKLIHIFEDEWIEKREIVESIIRTIMGLTTSKIGARSCIIDEISSEEARVFVDTNHLQGFTAGKIHIGLRHKGKLVSLLSLSKPRFNKKYEWEITRFCNKKDMMIMGGFSRLLKYFETQYHPKSIISYCDKRYFSGSTYSKNGFIEMENSSPSYYYTDYTHRFNRIEFQKHKLSKKLKIFNPKLTEWENMQLNGWDRIWDCGNSVFVKK